MNYVNTFISSLFFMSLFTSCISFQKDEGYKYLLFDAHGKVTNMLSQILEITGINHDGSLDDIVKQTQKNWLRGNIERFHLKEDFFENKKTELMPLFKKMNMIDEIRPTQKHYNYALLHGALLSRVRSRLAYLVMLW